MFVNERALNCPVCGREMNRGTLSGVNTDKLVFQSDDPLKKKIYIKSSLPLTPVKKKAYHCAHCGVTVIMDK